MNVTWKTNDGGKKIRANIQIRECVQTQQCSHMCSLAGVAAPVVAGLEWSRHHQIHRNDLHDLVPVSG